mgnify:FL=1
MNELYSNIKDCNILARKLKEQLGNKIEFYNSINTATPNGKYLSSYRKNKGEYISLSNNCLPYYFKFVKDGFLRISIGSHSKDNSLGEKIAALSDFYKVLCNNYGEPTVFYTLKNDDEKLLNLHWSFDNKTEEIAEFQKNTYFDDAEIDTLIVLNQNKENTEKHNQFDLPVELLHLIKLDIENFIKHKTGEEITTLTKKKQDKESILLVNKTLVKKKNQ